LEKSGIAYGTLDNGFRTCSDAAGLQKTCERLGPAAVQSFFARWWRRLPSPFTEADVEAGYRYQMAFRQFEVSDTCVFDRPQAGRMWGLRVSSGITSMSPTRSNRPDLPSPGQLPHSREVSYPSGEWI
jgi:hypothetical protein